MRMIKIKKKPRQFPINVKIKLKQNDGVEEGRGVFCNAFYVHFLFKKRGHNSEYHPLPPPNFLPSLWASLFSELLSRFPLSQEI